jgi:metal-responsive CopG/Arc/MetJ family transcriptional regulator
VRTLKRSVYSLVLNEDVIEAIDKMAYSLGTSRSNLINQILAEKVSLVTPEKRMDSIFGQIKELMFEDCYQIQERQSDSLMCIRSSVKYKYRPTVKYSVELFRNTNDGIGRLKVNFRTQNQMLLQLIDNFFHLWANLETTRLKKDITYSIEVGKYTRVFKNTNTNDVGVAISDYIHIFDIALKQYFRSPNDIELVRNIYQEYIANGVVIV